MAIATESSSLLTAKEFKQKRRIAPEGQIISHKATYTSIVLLLSMTMTAMAITAIGLFFAFAMFRYDNNLFGHEIRQEKKTFTQKEMDLYHEKKSSFTVMPLGVGSCSFLVLWCLIFQTFKHGVHPPSMFASLAVILVTSLILSAWSLYFTIDADRMENSTFGVARQYFNTYLADLEGLNYFGDDPTYIRGLKGTGQYLKCCGLYQADDFWKRRTLRSMGGENLAITLDWPRSSNISNSSIEVVPVFCCKNQSDPMCNIVDVENVKQPDIWKCGCGQAMLQPQTKILAFICMYSIVLCLLSIVGIIYTSMEVRKKKRMTS